MAIQVTGKSSAFLIGDNSHYKCTQAFKDRLSVEFANDLFGIKTNLNRIEQFLDISESVYINELGDPRSTPHPHLMVALGGDVNNIGTLREAIDRVRLAGGAPAWTWETVPSLSDLRTRFFDYKNCISVIGILEMKLALGRLSNGGPVAVKYIDLRQWYHVPGGEVPGYTRSEGIRSIAVWPDRERFEPVTGAIDNMGILEIGVRHFAFGSVVDSYKCYRRDAVLHPWDADESPLTEDYHEIRKPGIVNYYQEVEKYGAQTSGRRLENLWERNWKTAPAANQFKSGRIALPIFKLDNPSDSGTELEDLERAFTSLWEIGGVSGSVSGVASFDPGTISEDARYDWNWRYGCYQLVGPWSVYTKYNSETSQFDEIREGEFDLITETPSKDGSALPSNPYGWTDTWSPGVSVTPLTLLELDRPGSGTAVLIPFGLTPEITGDPFYHHPVNMSVAEEDAAHGNTIRGEGRWKTSNTDPTTENIDWTYTPGDTAAEEAAYEQLIENLFLHGEPWDTLSPPKKYVWCTTFGFDSQIGFTELMDMTLVNTDTESSGADLFFQEFMDHVNQENIKPTRLAAGEHDRQSFKGGVGSQGSAIQTRKVCNIGFPGYTGTGAQWLYWIGLVDDNGRTPLEEAVKRV